MKRKGFSLVEVVISIALIVILIGMTYSAITISMTQTNTNELERLALHEIQNLQDVFRCDDLEGAVNLYLRETSELDSEFHAMFYGEPESIFSSSRPEYHVRSLILYYNKSGGIIGFRSIADKAGSEVPQTLLAGQTESEAFTVTITAKVGGENTNFATSGAVFNFEYNINGNRTVYTGAETDLPEANKEELTSLAKTEIESLKKDVFSNDNRGLNPLSKALDAWYNGKTSSDGLISLSYGVVEASAPHSFKMFCVTELTLYYDGSGNLTGIETLAVRRYGSNPQPEDPETDRMGVNQPTGWALAITITVDKGQLFIDNDANFHFTATITGGETVYEDTKSSESTEPTEPTEPTESSSTNENG